MRKGFFRIITSVVIGAVLAYFGFFLQSSLSRRQEVASALANYYASAAGEYYAAEDLGQAEKQAPRPSYYIDLYKLEDGHYHDFLSASTALAAEVPPQLRGRVLSIEELWDQMNNEELSTTTETQWFDALDDIRGTVLGAIACERLCNPFWKWGLR